MKLSVKLYLLVAFLVVFAVMAIASSAPGEIISTKLDEVASAVAERDVTVSCRSVEEDYNLFWAWGYVDPPLDKTTIINMRDTLCVGALAIDLDLPEYRDWKKIVGVLVLAHEANHLKIQKGQYNEKITECRAMRQSEWVMKLLGAEKETIDRLMPLLMYEWQRYGHEHPDYWYPNCKVPKKYAKYLGNPPSWGM